MSAWHFASIPKKISEELKEKFAKKKRGFGSLRVEVRIGKSKWDTSIFPDKRSDTYLLPLKARVRKDEDIMHDDEIEFQIKIK